MPLFYIVSLNVTFPKGLLTLNRPMKHPWDRSRPMGPQGIFALLRRYLNNRCLATSYVCVEIIFERGVKSPLDPSLNPLIL